MKESEKSLKRRSTKKNRTLFKGYGIDIGAGNAGLNKIGGFNCYEWDTKDGDAQLMAGVPDTSYAWVHASHCLEHMIDPFAALTNWVRILKPSGHLVITVPDWEMYEREVWPSQFNPDHKWCFTAHTDVAPCDKLIHVNSIIETLAPTMRLKSIIVVDDDFNPELATSIDQTVNPYNAECAIELIFRKYTRNYSYTQNV
jgi:SAM-dependent methyltransferase